MPKGIYQRNQPQKPVQIKVKPPVEEGSAIDLGPDAALAVYKDRAGQKLGGMASEGICYAGTIAAEAAKVLEPEPERGTSDDMLEPDEL